MSPWVKRAGGGYVSKEKRIEHRAGASGQDEVSPRWKGRISWTLTWEGPPEFTLSIALPVLLSQRGWIRRSGVGVSVEVFRGR